jgi:hypothetical protein
LGIGFPPDAHNVLWWNGLGIIAVLAAVVVVIVAIPLPIVSMAWLFAVITLYFEEVDEDLELG